MTILAPTPQELHARVRAISVKMLDALERTVEQINPPPPERPALPLTVARRQMANLLGVPALCHRARCRRTNTCDGEPAHCLSVCIPALPHEVLARILSVKAMRQQLRRR